MFDDTRLDDRAALEAVDPLLRRLAEAGARVRREVGEVAGTIAALDVEPRPRAMVVVGADARLLRAVLEPWCPVPFVAWSGPGLPGWAGGLDLVVALAPTTADAALTGSVAEAVRRGCALVVACDERSDLADLAAGRDTTLLPTTTGDALPATVVVLAALHRLGLGPDVDADEVADALDAVAVAASPFREVGQNPAKELALGIGDGVPLLWGGSVLAARVARRLAESVRVRTGVPAVADGADHLVPVLDGVAPRDVFADPDLDGPERPRPVLVLLDDGTELPAVRADQGGLRAAAERGGVRVLGLEATHGSEVTRYARLLGLGSYVAVYLGVALGADPM